MKRMAFAHQTPFAGAGARPCALAYGQRWAVGVAEAGLISMAKRNRTTATTAPGRSPV
jgi:hypothetical protein